MSDEKPKFKIKFLVMSIDYRDESELARFDEYDQAEKDIERRFKSDMMGSSTFSIKKIWTDSKQ